MAAKEVDQILVGANGSIWVAPVGTAAPATEIAAYGAGWIELGYVNEDGVSPRESRTIKDILVWQLFYAARKIVTARAFEVKFSLSQWTLTTLPLAFGGGAITEPTPNHYKYTPPSPETIDERSLGVDWVDGTKHYRLIIPRGLVSDAVETKLARTDAALLPITFAVIGDDAGGAPWYILTDDPVFEVA